MRHLRLGFEKARERERSLILRAHAEHERANAALEQKARMGIEASAQMIQSVTNLMNELASAEDRPGDEIGVPVQIFSRAMEREIKPELNGAEIDGTRERVVDDARDAIFFSECEHPLEVADLERGIAHGFDVDQASLGSQQRRPALGIRRVDPAGGDAVARKILRDEGMRSAVKIFLNEQMIARFEERKECRGNGRHAA